MQLEACKPKTTKKNKELYLFWSIRKQKTRKIPFQLCDLPNFLMLEISGKTSYYTQFLVKSSFPSKKDQSVYSLSQQYLKELLDAKIVNIPNLTLADTI